jgi:hypothetical protein
MKPTSPLATAVVAAFATRTSATCTFTEAAFDAYIFNVGATPDDACRYAKGESIHHAVTTCGLTDAPLDFLAVTHHSEYLGTLPDRESRGSPTYNRPSASDRCYP